MVGDGTRHPIIQMVNHTRLDCVLGAAEGMRPPSPRRPSTPPSARAFGARLIDQPAMANVLADLTIEGEGATRIAMRLARAYDEAYERGPSTQAELFKRLATAVAQVPRLQARPGPRRRGARVPGWQRLRRGLGDAAPVPRGAPRVDLGGLGQRHGARRPARAALGPRDPAGVPGGGRRGRRSRRAPRRVHPARLRAALADPDELEHRARRVVEALALALQASLLVRHAPPAVADAFCAARLERVGGLAYGTLPAGVATARDRRPPHPAHGLTPEPQARRGLRGHDPRRATMWAPWGRRSPARPPVRDPHRRQPELVLRPVPVIYSLSGVFDDLLEATRRPACSPSSARCSSSSRCCCTSSATRSPRGATGSGSRDRPVALRRRGEAHARPESPGEEFRSPPPARP